MDDSQQPEHEDLDQDHHDIDSAMAATDHSFVGNGNGGMGSEFVFYSVDDDIVPRQYRRFVSGQHQERLYGNYDYLGGWSERVRSTSNVLLTYVIPLLIVAFVVGALLTGDFYNIIIIVIVYPEIYIPPNVF